MKRLITALLTVVFLGTMFFSLFHMSFGMDMGNDMAGCPFAVAQETICTMNLADHISSWQSLFVSVVPSLTLLFALAAAVVLFGTSLPPWLRFKLPDRLSIVRIKSLRERTYTFFYRSLQEFFSNGILHPKLF